MMMQDSYWYSICWLKPQLKAGRKDEGLHGYEILMKKCMLNSGLDRTWKDVSLPASSTWILVTTSTTSRISRGRRRRRRRLLLLSWPQCVRDKSPWRPRETRQEPDWLSRGPTFRCCYVSPLSLKAPKAFLIFKWAQVRTAKSRKCPK